MVRFEVLILGNSSATPMYGRHPSAQLINFNEQLILIDCGEGTQMQLVRYGIKAHRINHIFISHLHGDHYLGLPGLLSSLHLKGRKAALHLYGPAALQEILDVQFRHSGVDLQYELVFHPTNPNQRELILDSPSLKVSSFPLNHRIACTGFRFDEAQDFPRLDKDRVEQYQIPKSYLGLLKRGIDYVGKDGTVYKASDFTLPAEKLRSYCYCSDTAKTPSYWSAIEGVSLLYHESTFLHDMQERATETLHSTSVEAAEVAKIVQADKLLLGHFSARYRDLQPFLDESQPIFANTMLSEEGKWFLV